MSNEEILTFIFLMVLAGNETTTKLLGSALYWADRNPAEFAKVAAAHDLIPDWVEETARYDSPTQSLVRTASTDLEYYGRTVPAGAMVLLVAVRRTATRTCSETRMSS